MHSFLLADLPGVKPLQDDCRTRNCSRRFNTRSLETLQLTSSPLPQQFLSGPSGMSEKTPRHFGRCYHDLGRLRNDQSEKQANADKYKRWSLRVPSGPARDEGVPFPRGVAYASPTSVVIGAVRMSVALRVLRI